MPLLIIVRAARGDRRVALSEAHPDHPGGQAWITGDGREHVVALTREAARRIGDGSLDLVEAVEIPGTVEEGGAPLELGELIAPGTYPPGAVDLPVDPAPTGPWQPFGTQPDEAAPAPRRKR